MYDDIERDLTYLEASGEKINATITLHDKQVWTLTKNDLFQDATTKQKTIYQAFPFRGTMYLWSHAEDKAIIYTDFKPESLKLISTGNPYAPDDVRRSRDAELKPPALLTSKMWTREKKKALTPFVQTQEQYEADLRQYEIAATARARRDKYKRKGGR